MRFVPKLMFQLTVILMNVTLVKRLKILGSISVWKRLCDVYYINNVLILCICKYLPNS